jgi:dTDP-4-amino-4,6-dideoxy-D-galactose acyltransferase
MIEKVSWDSDFFGYTVGKVNFNSDEDFTKFLKIDKNAFRLIYIFSQNELELVDEYTKKVDTKLTFTKIIEIKTINDPNLSIKKVNIKEENFESILQLAYLSGKYSRFKLDENFKNEEFKKMYKVWISNTTNNKKIIVKYVNSEIVGLVVYSICKTKVNIELISVSEVVQGQGIASELIREIEKIGHENKCNTVEVVTQGINLPATNLYKKNNFNISNSILIYHYWNI